MKKIVIELTPMYENEFGVILGNKEWRIFTFKGASEEFDRDDFDNFLEKFKDEVGSMQDILEMLREEHIEDSKFKQEASNLAEVMVFIRSKDTHLIMQKLWSPFFEILDQCADDAGIPDNPVQRVSFIMSKLIEHIHGNEELF